MDTNLATAKRAWQHVADGAGGSGKVASKIYADLCASRRDPAFGWAALTLGRLAGIAHRTQEAEIYLTEGVGTFTYRRNAYGKAIAEAHLAIPAIGRMDLDSALAFAQAAWASGLIFEDHDADFLHAISANVYWNRDEMHPTLMHLAQSLEIADRASNAERRLVLMTNISSVLIELGQYRLAASVSDESVRLAEVLSVPTPHHIRTIINQVLAHDFAGNAKGAEQSARRALEMLARGALTDWQGRRILCRYYALHADPPEAERQLKFQRDASDLAHNPSCKAPLMLSEAEVLEAQGDYHGAIAIAKKVLESPVSVVSRGAYRFAAQCLSRCYSAMGRSAESTRWKKFAQTHTQTSPLDAVFASQIGSHLRKETLNPLTPQEMECLSLSARGQSSADIGLKLGIKPRTVNFHMAKVLRKLHAVNRHEAIAKAITADFLRM